MAGVTTPPREARAAPPCPAFHPQPWARGGHRQTLLGYWSRRGLRWSPPTDDLVIEAEEDVRLLVRASFQAGPGEASPALVLVHGLGGSDDSSYVVATGLLAWERGFHVLRMNMRGAGASEALCPRLYNAGLDTDLLAVLERAAQITPHVALAGFSLGGSLVLLTLGRRARHLSPALKAAAVVSAPLDLSACVDALERPLNRVYQWHFLASLRGSYSRRQLLRPDLYEAGREKGIRTVREYDERITAPYGGYPGAADYYARSSPGPFLLGVERPTLILAAEDDPMIPQESVARWPLAPAISRQVLRTGGHMGFVAASAAPGRFWAAERLCLFLAEELRTRGSDRADSQGS